MLQTAAVALAATYAVASSLSVAPSTSHERESSPGALESIPEIHHYSCDSSITMEEDEESKFDMMEYTEAVKFDDEDNDKRAPLYAVEERNYAKTSWTRSISMSRAPRARMTSSKSLNNLSTIDYEVPDMTACNSLNALTSFSTASPTRSTSDFFNLKPQLTNTTSTATNNCTFHAMKSSTATGGNTIRSSSSDFFGLKAPARAATNRVSTQRNAQWAIMG